MFVNTVSRPLPRWLRPVIPLHMTRSWRTFTLGEPRAAEAYQRSFDEHGIHSSAEAECLMRDPEFGALEIQLGMEIVTISAGDLEFEAESRFGQIIARARTWGLCFCPPGVGPALRLAYENQPQGELLVIAMAGLGGPADSLLFTLDHDDDGLWIDVHDDHPDVFWSAETRFAFVYPD